VDGDRVLAVDAPVADRLAVVAAFLAEDFGAVAAAPASRSSTRIRALSASRSSFVTAPMDLICRATSRRTMSFMRERV
jgi:hypothetical protein